MVTLTTRDFHGWPHTQFLSNDSVELILTADVGPRILGYAVHGGPNVMFLFEDQLGLTGGQEFRAYGGHRLWHAPEALPRTYTLDNHPLTVEPVPNGVRLTMPADEAAGIEKSLEVTLAETGSVATLKHSLVNRTLWPVELAPWSLTQACQGGLQILPLPPYAPHSPESLLPVNTFTLWSYTNFADPRWRLGARYITLRQDPNGFKAQKLGVRVADGWAAYAFKDHLFVKRFAWDPKATYPDHDVNYETYSDPDFLELEALGPVINLQPGQSVTHVERWGMFAGVPEPKTDDDIARDVLPRALSVPPVV